jgi:hypothetical protein
MTMFLSGFDQEFGKGKGKLGPGRDLAAADGVDFDPDAVASGKKSGQALSRFPGPGEMPEPEGQHFCDLYPVHITAGSQHALSFDHYDLGPVHPDIKVQFSSQPVNFRTQRSAGEFDKRVVLY